MKRHLMLLAVCVLLSACSSASYKVAPTSKVDKHVAKVAENVSKATVSAKASRERARALAASLTAGNMATRGVITAIDAAIRSLELKEFPQVGVLLIEAKMGAGFLLAENLRLQAEVSRMAIDMDILLMDLSSAYDGTALAMRESEKFQKDVNKLAESQAKAQAIVNEVNWGFGLGAIIYGVKRILTFGFFGVIGLIVIVIVLLAIGGPVALFTLRGLKYLWGLWRNRKSG